MRHGGEGFLVRRGGDFQRHQLEGGRGPLCRAMRADGGRGSDRILSSLQPLRSRPTGPQKSLLRLLHGVVGGDPLHGVPQRIYFCGVHSKGHVLRHIRSALHSRRRHRWISPALQLRYGLVQRPLLIRSRRDTLIPRAPSVEESTPNINFLRT